MVRLALVLGKQDFENVIVPFEKWAAVKPTVPLGSVPVAEIDGKRVVQSMALVRYFGKLSGLYPADAWKSLMVDQVVETVMDMQAALFGAKGEGKDGIREAREKMMKEAVPRFWGGAEKMLKGISNGPFVLGDEISIVDVCITSLYLLLMSEFLDYVPKDGLNGYPRMDKVFSSITAVPEVKEWYTKNPIPNLTV